MKIFRLLLILVLVPYACSSPGRRAERNEIIIDTKGVDMYAYEVDLRECKEFAEQVQVGGEAVKRGVGGAVVGGAIGAIIGDSDTAERGAGVGAVTGAVSGARSGSREKQQVVRNCLIGRGYKVLN